MPASGHQQSAAAAQLRALANQLDGAQFDTLRASLEARAASTRPHKVKGKQASPGASAKARGNSPAHGVAGDSDEKLNAEQDAVE